MKDLNPSTRTIVGTALVAGVLIGLAPGRWDVVIALAALVGMAALVGGLFRPPRPRVRRPPLTPRQGLALASLYLVLISTLVFRQRTASDISSNPLDAAGTFRVASLGAAFAVACLSMVATRLSFRVAWPVRLYVAYVLVVPLGGLAAVSQQIVAFKWVELAVMALVWFALSTAFPGKMETPLRHFGVFIGLLVAAVVLNVLFLPDRSLIEVPGSILPAQVTLVYPQFSANEVGALGLIVLAFGLGRRQPSAGLVALGMSLVVLAQYRTGYVTVLVLVVLFLALRRQAAARVVLVVLLLALPLFIQSSTFEDAWVRGESSQTVSTLTGRTVWWGEGIDAASRSPIYGIGLASGVRYEVLEARFNAFTSTIHSTWVEAYVGTGLVGVSLLAAALVTGLAAAWRYARVRTDLVPLLLLAVLAVRSITSSTIDIGGYPVMLFLIAVSVATPYGRRVHAEVEERPRVAATT